MASILHRYQIISWAILYELYIKRMPILPPMLKFRIYIIIYKLKIKTFFKRNKNTTITTIAHYIWRRNVVLFICSFLLFIVNYYYSYKCQWFASQKWSELKTNNGNKKKHPEIIFGSILPRGLYSFIQSNYTFCLSCCTNHGFNCCCC